MSAAGLFTIGVLVTLIVGAAMALLLYAAILDGRDGAARRTHGEASMPKPSANILQTAQEAGRFATLVTALDRAGLSDALAHEGPYTVFAPTDEAFTKLPEGVVESLLGSPETLAEVLNYHVVPGRMTAAEVAARHWTPTIQGEDLLVSNNGAIHVDRARVIAQDIEASNGVMHVIDRVLLPARL